MERVSFLAFNLPGKTYEIITVTNKLVKIPPSRTTKTIVAILHAFWPTPLFLRALAFSGYTSLLLPTFPNAALFI